MSRGMALRRLAIVSGLLLIPMAAVAAARKPSDPPPPASPLELKLFLDKSSYAPADPILVKLGLKNVSEQPLWIVARFYLSGPEVSSQHRDAYLEVVGPSGQSIAGTAKFETGLPKTDDFKELPPGGEVTGEGQVNLRYLFDVKEPGTYHVTAVYENVFGPELGLETFRGTLRSAPATFTIEAGS